MPKSFLNQDGYPIGLRNNNPGNIRPGDNWQGMIGQNGGFVVFENIGWGIRALAIDLTSKINEGYNTVSEIIYRWAPPSDGNDTENYVEWVCDKSGFSRDQALQPSADTLHRLIAAIIPMEIGSSYAALITGSDIDEGISMMGGAYAGAGGGGMGLILAIGLGIAIFHKQIFR